MWFCFSTDCEAWVSYRTCGDDGRSEKSVVICWTLEVLKKGRYLIGIKSRPFRVSTESMQWCSTLMQEWKPQENQGKEEPQIPILPFSILGPLC